MNLRTKIEEWRKVDQPYGVGLAILEEAVSNGAKCSIISVLRTGKTSFTKSRLQKELDFIYESCAPSPTVKKFGAIDTKDFPEDLKELYKETISNLRMIDQFKGQIFEIYYDDKGSAKKSPDEKRGYAIANKIQRTYSRNQEHWARLDYWKEHGTYLPGTEPKQVSIERLKELLKIQPTVIEYMSKARTRIKQSKPINAAHFAKYEAIEKEIKLIIS